MAKKRYNRRAITVGFVALGCPKNIVDSEKMLARIAEAGFVITADPDNADVVIINTCGFIAPAKAEALEAVRHAVDCKMKGNIRKVIVAGCLPERIGKELFDQASGIDAIVGLTERDNIAGIVEETLFSNKSITHLEGSCHAVDGETKRGHLIVPDDRARLLITPHHWAYLRISEGCNHRCSFCTIPAIRGRFRSKPKNAVCAEAAELVQAGVVELNVIAQDTTYYGRDLKTKESLAMLLKDLEKIEGLKWIRLMYLYPSGITDELIETISESSKIVHYLDIPVQHIDSKILKDMHRIETKEYIYRLIEKLREAIGDIVLRTTVMVGFTRKTDHNSCP